MEYNNGDILVANMDSRLVGYASHFRERTGACKELGLVWVKNKTFYEIKDRAEKLGYEHGRSIVFIIENKHTFLLAKLKYEI